MQAINWKSVLIGGLAAGLVVNVSEAILNLQVIAEQNAAGLKALGKSGEVSGTQIAWFNVIGFLTGISIVWLYAAIRPRFGAGVRTALCAGAVVWFVGFVLGNSSVVILGLFTGPVVLIGWAWSLCEVLIAATLGAKLYKEQEEPAGAKAAMAAR